MKVLITGITGFVGSHLAEYLLSLNHEVYGIYRWRSRMENIEGIVDDITLINADIKDSHSIQKAFKEVKPDYCFHLAGQSFVKESWNSPSETMSANILGTVNVLEAIRTECPGCKIMLAGSSEEYGLVKPEETPITESNDLRPMSPYGISKLALDKLGVMYHMSYGLHTVVTRAFNHEGPRRGDVFVTSNFAKQIALLEKPLWRGTPDYYHDAPPVMWVGNLEAKRDWTDVRDMVRAYWLALFYGEPGEVYNICRGTAWSVQEMLDTLLSMTSLEIEIKQDPNRLRPSDVPLLLGDCSKFWELTHWYPTISFETMLKDMLDYWRARV